MNHKVFVYGTLRSGDCRGGALKAYDCLSNEAYLEGFDLLDLGSFPGIVPGNSRVRGELYSVDDDCLKRLDTIEGFREDDPVHSLYRRETVTVESQSGEIFNDVFTYVFNRDTTCGERPIIESGDWFECCNLYEQNSSA